MKLLLCACLLATAIALVACDGDSSNDSTTATPPVATTTVAAIPTQPPPTPTVVASTATLVIIPPATPPRVGAPVRVVVRITGATNLAAFQFTPRFDPAILELVNISDAGFAGSSGRVPSCSLSRTETVTFFCVSGGPQPPGASGDGDLAVIEFRALATGQAQIALDRISATMPDATDIPLTFQPITITVQ